MKPAGVPGAEARVGLGRWSRPGEPGGGAAARALFVKALFGGRGEP